MSVSLRRLCAVSVAVWIAAPLLAGAQSASQRPMTFLDMQQMRQVGSPAPSPDGRWLLYTVSTPDWKEAQAADRHPSGVAAQGVSSTRQMTFTKEKNETAPQWARDGSFFVFLSNREAPESSPNRAISSTDAARWRRGAAHHRREGRRVRLRDQPRRSSGSSIAAARPARNSCTGCRRRRIDTAKRRTDHEARDRGSSRGSGRPTAGASIS